MTTKTKAKPKASAMRYFVYDLMDPRTGKTFYVGKGKGDRPAFHTKEARAGVVSRKCETIREILRARKKVKVVIIEHFGVESEAYVFEHKRILDFGLDNLTNISPGSPENPPFRRGDNDQKFVQAGIRFLRVLGNMGVDPARFAPIVARKLRGIARRRGCDFVISEYNRYAAYLRSKVELIRSSGDEVLIANIRQRAIEELERRRANGQRI